MNEGTDYNFIEKESSDFYSIKLLTSKWKNVIYTYGKVSIVEDEEADQARLKFDFKIEDSCKFEEYELNTLEFKNHLGDVLVDILIKSDAKIGQHTDAKRSTNDNSKPINS